jgi:putative tryptophan/tyrosine transport system substrate-binding protein
MVWQFKVRENIFLGAYIKKVILFLLLLLLICDNFSSYASEVLVIKGADIKPYNEALEGFKSSCQCNINELVPIAGEQRDISRAISEIKPVTVFAIGVDALKQAQAIKGIPVVYTMVPYSASVPAQKNISGVSMYISPEKYLNLISEVFPNAKRIGLIYNPKNSDRFVKEVYQRADSMELELVAKRAEKAGEIPALIDSMKGRIDIFLMLPDTSIVSSESFNYMLLFSFLNEVPVVTFSKKYVELGASAGLNIDTFDLGLQAGEIMRRILRQNSQGLPEMADARKTVLVINKKVMRKFGIKIRDDLKGAEYVE